jgi:uncharacterized repeat protein (TIGR01451 family)
MSLSRKISGLIAFVLALAAPLAAAISYDSDAVTYKLASGSASYTNSFTPGAGSNEVLFVMVQYEGSPPASNTVTFNGLSLTPIRNDGIGSNNVFLYYLTSPTSSAHNIVLTPSATYFTGAFTMTAFTYSGVATNPLGANAGTTGGPSSSPYSISLSITPTNPSSTIVEFSAIDLCSLPTNLTVTNGTKRFSSFQGETNQTGLGIGDWAPGTSGTPVSFNHAYTAGGCGGSSFVEQAVELIPAPVNTVNATCGTATVDGNLSDSVWSTSTVKTMTVCSVGPCPGTGGSAQFQTAYDSANLYVAFTVVDANLYANSGAPWNGSAAEIFLDFANDRGGTMDGADYQFVITYNAATIVTYRNGAGVGTPAGIVAASVTGGGGYTMEVKIPWAGLGVAAPSSAQISSIDAAVDFANVAKNARDHQYGAWGPGNTPNNWGFVQYQTCAGSPTNTPTTTATQTPATCGAPSLCGDTFILNGSAKLIRTGEIQMTQYSTWLNGSAWDPNNQDIFNNDFNYNFWMDFGTDGNGADGMTFTLQSQGTSALGCQGGDLGLDNQALSGSSCVSTRITPALSVEFDTYQNTASPPANDPPFDHIAIDEMGSINHASGCPGTVVLSGTTSGTICAVQAGTTASIKDGLWHAVNIKWNHTTHVMQVYFDGNLRITYTNDIVTNIFGGTHCVTVGFTGGTGGQINDQRVRLCPYTPDQAACGSPVIDGNLNDSVWTGQTFTSLGSCSVPTCPGTGGSASFATAYDSTNFYVAFNVTDPNHYANAGAPWNGSAVEINFDGSPPDAETTMDAGDHQWIIPWDASEVIKYSNGANNGSDATVTAAHQVAGSTYTIEVAIPWTTVGVAVPSAGALSAFDVGVDFANSSLNGRDHQLGYEYPGSNPNGWGEVQYGACIPTPTPTISATATRSATYSYSPTASPTPTVSATATASATVSPTGTQTATPGPSFTVSPTYTPIGCANTPTFKTASLLQASQDGNNVPSDTFSYTLPAGLSAGLLVVPISHDTADTISSITYNGSTLSLFHSDLAVGSGAMSIYYLAVGTLSGPFNLVVNFSPNAQNKQWIIEAQVYDNVNQASPMGAYNYTNNNTAASFNTTLTTTSPNSIVLDYMDDNNSAIDTMTHSVPQAWTLAVADTSGFHAYSDYITAGAPGLQTMSYSWTPSGQTIASQMIEIKGSACVPSPTSTPTASGTTTATGTATPTPAWAITKTSNVAQANLGDTITYTISWTNYSSSNQNMVIWDTISPYLTFQGASPAYSSYVGGLMLWNLGSVASGATGTIQIWATVTSYPYWPFEQIEQYAIKPRIYDANIFLAMGYGP